MSLLFSKRSDHVLDMSQRPRKRSTFGHGNFEPASKEPKMTLNDNYLDDPLIDEDYKKFLYALEKNSKEPEEVEVEEKEKGKEGDEENEDGDDYRDPQYRMFMENLREDGNSYILQISKQDVMTLCIKYEGEDSRLSGGNGNDWAIPREEDKSNSATPRGETKGNLATPVEDGSASTATREEDRRNSAIRREDMKTSSAPSKENRGNLVTPIEEDKGNSAARREEDRRHSVSPREKDWRNAVKTEDIQSLEVPCSELNVLKEVKMEMSDPFNSVSHGVDGGSCVNSESYQLLLNRRKLKDIAADILTKSGRSIGLEPCLMKRRSLARNSHFPSPLGQLLTKKEEHILTKRCKQLKRDNNDGETLLHRRKFVTNSAYVHRPLHGKRSIGRGQSQFREELMDTLRMPHRPREYEELLQEFTIHRQIRHDRRLRGGVTKEYVTGVLGQSYREQYPDLAKKIDLVRSDRPTVLNLLRGFFYWLKKLPQEGAFKPWLDSSCLKEVTRDTSSSQIV
ncbi:uncharacterized protein LOC132173868 isoform X2 [Corylus avellana]|uniref:uncharacterized protein LOC132173868 isoform X2 n=1 Tax=Corylus avellana TaxID=13451 RepID=UPI00286A3921|nr:uncharacterized protein LOC132173868 isoform X2 [Corylus avellana]